MSKVNSFDRANIRQINAEIENALSAVAQKYGVEINLKNTRFSTDNYSTKIEVCTLNNGNVMTKEAIDFNRYKNIKGINAELGDAFNYQGDIFTITGYKSRSSKYPILAVSNNNGKTYKFPISLVNRYV
jgi:hypothetical protein